MKVYVVKAHNYCADNDLVIKIFDNEFAARQFVNFFNEKTKKEYEWGVANFFEKEVYSDF